MRSIFFFKVFSIGFACFGQTHLQGKVVNSETTLGVPFATVTYKNVTGQRRVIYTDSVGKFSIKTALSDLIISCVGYETINYDIEQGNDDVTIQSSPVSVQFQSVNVSAKPKKRIRLGYFKDQELTGPVGFGNYVGPSGERANYVAQFVPNKTRDSTLLITKLLYNLVNDVRVVNRSKLTLATNCTTNRLRPFI
ncbi:carboxypeptidase-like regulatory domain-containing protein [Pedobacter endophyticus]|uniref:Carboxypeptidase-like regulatory domain-containing protein n=1 Tax=Pedobacter endophyticus TaxID=2789740 RepID=A0A7U3Q456_9SPHI|nr:carboxypeptidase-like regulatory domain-containing protein [Pedobacter endophyticus]QPH38265.1 carboxypeptidase-like regulatory domain-containing protein [Pedobacter endophyticus]